MTTVPLTEKVRRIIAAAPALAQLRPVIEKELIHYDIFYVLQHKALMLPEMAFVGGTCLRLCYGSNRYSEDIDFHAGANFQPKDFERIRSELEGYIFGRYGFETEVRSPKQVKKDSDLANSRISTWKVIVKTGRGRKDLPQQRINIDIACLPVYEASPQIIRTNYKDFPDGYSTMFVRCSSLSEILADKLVAVPARNNIKARDLWDILWLRQKGAVLRPDLIRLKIIDHGITGHYKSLLEDRINGLPGYFEKQLFQQEMSRFLDKATLSETAAKPEFVASLSAHITDTLTSIHEALYSSKKAQSEFVS